MNLTHLAYCVIQSFWSSHIDTRATHATVWLPDRDVRSGRIPNAGVRPMAKPTEPTWAQTQAERRESLTRDALDLIGDGESVNEAARMLDVQPSTLRGWLKRW